MKDLARIRLSILKELKNLHRFIEMMENNVRARNEAAIQRTYIFLSVLTYHMNDGDLSPDNIIYNIELAKAFQELDELNNEQ